MGVTKNSPRNEIKVYRKKKVPLELKGYQYPFQQEYLMYLRVDNGPV